MDSAPKIQVGQFSSAGRKDINQDSLGFKLPSDDSIHTKGVAVAIADGISSSEVSQFASAAAVQGFLADYYSTSDAWSLKTSALKVLTAINAWLYSQSLHSHLASDMNRGYVCTFSAIIFKSSTGHIFHSGDARIYKVHNDHLEQLTKDHRFQVSANKSYLTRAFGMEEHVEFDYRSFPLQSGDNFVLATDGVYEFINHRDIIHALENGLDNLDLAAEKLANLALERGSNDNLSIQLIHIEKLPNLTENEILKQLTALPFPPELEARMEFDGFQIIRKIHASPRSHVFIAKDLQTEQTVILKTPSMELRDDPSYIERFILEEWIARRINSAHVLKPVNLQRRPNFIYIVSEFVEGITLKQWMADNPKPNLNEVRNIVQQITRGLRAFHRHEMLHQDLKPDNIMIDKDGTVKIIDFGSVSVAGLSEIDNAIEHFHILGTLQYTAPEYFLGHSPNAAADIFSVGVIAYEMLTGKLPYGLSIIKTRTDKEQSRLNAIPINQLEYVKRIPEWASDAILKAIHISPEKRYQEIDEFNYDLFHPNKAFIKREKPPLIARNPLKFWQGISASLLLTCICLLYMLLTH